MKTLTIMKGENIVQELCIAYGLFSILRENRKRCKLKNKKACFLIEMDSEVDFEELTLSRNKLDTEAPINGTSHSGEHPKNLDSLFGSEPGERKDGIKGFFDDEKVISNIFKYYETLDESYLKDFRKTGTIYIGSAFFVKGQRGYNKSVKAQKIWDFERQLSFLGYLRATGYVKVGKAAELTWLPIPNEEGISSITQLTIFTYIDKETGERKNSYFLGQDSSIVATAKSFINIQKLFERESVSSKYEGLFLLKTVPSVNKSLMDKVIHFPLLPFSKNSLECVDMKLKVSRVSLDCKYALATYLVTPTLQHFSQLARTFAKEGEGIPIYFTEELIQLHQLSEVYNSNFVQRMGTGLYIFMKDKKGYQFQVELLTCATEAKLMDVIKEMSLLYSRSHNGRSLLNDVQMQELLELLKDGVSVKTIADCILICSNTYKPKDKKQAEEAK